ncbi:MAG: hypothetical protein ACSHX0_13155 [Akkermansiaceae bacterium]
MKPLFVDIVFFSGDVLLARGTDDVEEEKKKSQIIVTLNCLLKKNLDQILHCPPSQRVQWKPESLFQRTTPPPHPY